MIIIGLLFEISGIFSSNSKSIESENHLNIPVDILADSVHKQFRYVLPNNIGDKFIEDLNDSLSKLVKVKYHYTVEISTVSVDPEYYEVDYIGGNEYRVRKEPVYSELDGYYSFDSYEPITSINGLYKYIKSHISSQ